MLLHVLTPFFYLYRLQLQPALICDATDILLHPRPSGEVKLMLPGMHMTQVWSLSEINDLTRHSAGEKCENIKFNM